MTKIRQLEPDWHGIGPKKCQNGAIMQKNLYEIWMQKEFDRKHAEAV